MKRLIFIFALLLCCSAVQANARGIMTMCGAGVPVAGCTTPTGDELTESFGDASTSCWSGGDSLCNNTWTVQAGTPTIDDVTGTPAANTACAKVIHIDGATNVYKDLGDGTIPNNVEVEIKFHLYVHSSSINQYSNVGILSLNANSASIIDGNMYVSCHLYRAGAGASQPADRLYCGSSANSITISAETHYDCAVILDAEGAAGGSSISCNGGAAKTFTRGTTASRYVHVGSSAANQVLDIGYVTVSTP